MSHPLKNLLVVCGAVGLAVTLLEMQDSVQAQQAGQGAAQGAGQGGGQAAPQGPPPTARASAPYDPTGQWVSVITNNWRNRMVPPPRGGNADIPLNAAGTKIADSWPGPAPDEAAKAECKYYGAASLLFQPTRLRVTWQDDQTLRIDTDAGTQTRLFRFTNATPEGTTTATAAPGPRTYQGSSIASWESRRPAAGGGGGGGGGRGGRGAAAQNPAARYLKVTTTNMLPGYLRKNGVPYGEQASLIEYFDVVPQSDGTTMMFVTIAVTDPEFLNGQYAVIAHFKKESAGDAAKWEPSPCSARW